MNDNDVIARLQGFAAAHSIDDDVASAHQALMSSATGASRMRGRALLAGGTLVVALFSGTGIAAAAGSLPEPAQNVAHSALKKVGVKVPKGTPVACEDAVNHGQYVRSQPKGGQARSAAAKSDCGKKAKDADETEVKTEDTEVKTKEDKAGDKGKPDTTPAADKSKAGDTPAADKQHADEAPVDGAENNKSGDAPADAPASAEDNPGKARAEVHKPAKP